MSDLLKRTKETLVFSLPIMGARLVSAASGFIAMVMIAMLGHQQLAAGALVASIGMLIYIVGWSSIFSLAVVVGHDAGAGKIKELGQILRQGWLLGSIVSIPMMLIFWNVGPLLHFLGQPKQLVDLVDPYFRILVWGIFPGLLYVGFIQFVTGVSKPKVVLYTSILSIFFLILPGYCLMFGMFGLPRLGMIGMAYASIFSSWCTGVIGIAYLYFHPHYKQFQIFKLSKERDFHYLKQIFNLGYPLTIQFAAELTALAFSSIMIGWLGEASLAAQQIILQLGYVLVMGPYGIAQASSILVSVAIGRGRLNTTRTYSHAGILLGFIFTLVVAILYIVFPKELIGLFSINVKDPSLATTVRIAVVLLAIRGVSQIFDGLRNVATGILRGFHDTKVPMLIALIASWGIGIPTGYIMAFWFGLGAAGIAAGFLLAWIFGSVILLKRLHRKTMCPPDNLCGTHAI